MMVALLFAIPPEGAMGLMKIMISADMEGTCGVSSWIHVDAPEEVSPGRPFNQSEYDRARRRMTAEVNAAIEGALQAGATGIIVNDSHDGQRNLIPEDLHETALYISGADKPLGMMQGVDEPDVDAVFYTGYHAKAGTPGGPLAHTWSSVLQDVRFDGESTGEFGLNAAVAGYFGVPVVLVTGDHLAVEQTRGFLGEQVIGVEVKRGLSTTSAMHVHPRVAQERIREGAAQAIKSIETATPYVLPEGVTVELEYDHQSRADQIMLLPNVRRAGERTIAFEPEDGLDFIRIFRACNKLAGIRMSP